MLFSQMWLKDVRNVSRSKQTSIVAYGVIQWNRKNIHNENSTNWEGPEHLLFAYKITVFNFHMYQLWEQILFAFPEIGEKNGNANSMQSCTDKVVSQALTPWGQDAKGTLCPLAIVSKFWV